MKKISALLTFVVLTGLILSCAEQGEPDEIMARHILIMYEGSAAATAEIVRTKEEAKAYAYDVLALVNEGQDFSELAKQHSDGPTKIRGGLLNPFGRGKMSKPFEDAAFALKVGQVSDVVETEFGFHIIKRVE
jgi:parvulin-like peptidyl-prolyl isomerase